MTPNALTHLPRIHRIMWIIAPAYAMTISIAFIAASLNPLIIARGAVDLVLTLSEYRLSLLGEPIKSPGLDYAVRISILHTVATVITLASSIIAIAGRRCGACRSLMLGAALVQTTSLGIIRAVGTIAWRELLTMIEATKTGETSAGIISFPSTDVEITWAGYLLLTPLHQALVYILLALTVVGVTIDLYIEGKTKQNPQRS